MIPRHRDIAWGLASLGLAVAVWEIAGRLAGDLLFAPPSSVVPILVSLVLDGRILIDLASTVGQMLAGFALACLVGFPLGVLMARVKWVDMLVHPWISMLVVTSMAALAPIAILLLGTGFMLRLFIVFAGSVGYIVLIAFDGARSVSREYVDVARSFQLRGPALYRRVLLPALFPYAMTAARLGVTHALRAMIMAEMFVITGFGGMIYRAGLEISTAYLISHLILLMAVSAVLTWAVRRAGERLAPWYALKYGGA